MSGDDFREWDLAQGVRKFLRIVWHTQLRDVTNDAAEARELARLTGVADGVRDFLRQTIHVGTLTPEEWKSWFKVELSTAAEVSAEANQLWAWLYDGEPVPPPESTSEPGNGE